MTKSYDQLDTRAALIEAALVEMAEKGWGGLRTREVAERAGVNKGLVHYHFGSMDNLRLETVGMLMSGVVNEAAAALIEASTIAAGVREFGEHLGSFRSDDPRGVVLMEAMLHVRREEWLEEMMLRALDSYEEALRRRIEADIAAGTLAAETNPVGLATALTAALDGMALHAYMRPGADLASAAESLATLIERAAPSEMQKKG
jgi:AcrR family transcriptional regulator